MHLLLSLIIFALTCIFSYVAYFLNDCYWNLLCRIDGLEHRHRTISDLVFKHITRKSEKDEKIQLL